MKPSVNPLPDQDNTLPALLESLAAEDPQQVQRILAEIVFEEQKQARRLQLLAASIDVEAEIARFLEQQENPNTKTAYRTALERLRQWSTLTGTSPLAMQHKDASEFLIAMRVGGMVAPSTVASTSKRLSAWFSWMLYEHPEMEENPFYRNRSRPHSRPAQKRLPTQAEVELVRKNLEPKNAAAFEAVVSRGIMPDDLGRLVLDGKRFVVEGRKHKGTLPPVVLKKILAAGLDPVRPFPASSDRAWSKLLWWHVKKLASAGVISHAYSPKDFFQFFVTQSWAKSQDLIALRDLLGYSDVRSTTSLLRTIGLLK